jgi:hypothetical protein
MIKTYDNINFLTFDLKYYILRPYQFAKLNYSDIKVKKLLN